MAREGYALRKVAVGNTYWYATPCEKCGSVDCDWAPPNCRHCRKVALEGGYWGRRICASCWPPDCTDCSGPTPLFGKRRIARCKNCKQFYHLSLLKSGRCHECSGRNRILASAPRDNYDRYDIAARDHWICGICGESINRALTDTADPGYLNIDHIIPVTDPSFPGDILSNVQATHRICNIRKGGFRGACNS